MDTKAIFRSLLHVPLEAFGVALGKRLLGDLLDPLLSRAFASLRIPLPA